MSENQCWAVSQILSSKQYIEEIRSRAAETFFGWSGKENGALACRENFEFNDVHDCDVITIGREDCISRVYIASSKYLTRQKDGKQVSPRTRLSSINNSCSLMRQKSGLAKT